MKLQHLTLSALTAFALIIVSCEDEATKAKVQFIGYESYNVMKRTLAVAEYQFDSASMILENFSMSKMVWNDSIAKNVDDSAAYFDNLEKYAYSYYGPYHTNLITGQTSPDIDFIELESGIYHNLDIRMGNGTGDSICLYLAGSVMTESSTIPFEVSIKYGISFMMTNPSGFVIMENSSNIVWASIHLPDLFEGINIEMATEDNDGTVRINDQSNIGLQETIIQNLDLYSEVGLDLNMDGKIDG